jgi:hypothetical protein
VGGAAMHPFFMPNCQCNFFSFCAKLSGEKNQFGKVIDDIVVAN